MLDQLPSGVSKSTDLAPGECARKAVHCSAQADVSLALPEQLAKGPPKFVFAHEARLPRGKWDSHLSAYCCQQLEVLWRREVAFQHSKVACMLQWYHRRK
jgi:hypothetical protein